MKEIKFPAKLEYLDQVLEFVNEQLLAFGCTKKALMQMDIAVEEIFVNIAHYAYGNETGVATICIDTMDDPSCAEVTFSDCGIPYNPLMRPDPDITLPSDKRPIGGLGIYMVKKSMDDVQYEHKDGRNILKIQKNL